MEQQVIITQNGTWLYTLRHKYFEIIISTLYWANKWNGRKKFENMFFFLKLSTEKYMYMHNTVYVYKFSSVLLEIIIMSESYKVHIQMVIPSSR